MDESSKKSFGKKDISEAITPKRIRSLIDSLGLFDFDCDNYSDEQLREFIHKSHLIPEEVAFLIAVHEQRMSLARLGMGAALLSDEDKEREYKLRGHLQRALIGEQ